MTAKQEAYKKYKDIISDQINPLDSFEAGWVAAIQWAAENATMETTWDGNTGSEYPDDHVNKQSILKGLE